MELGELGEPGEPGELGVAAWGDTGGSRLGGRGLLELAVASGVAAWATWALLLMPGFRRVPLRLQVPYQPSSPQQVANVLALLRDRSGKTVDLGSGDGRLVVEAYKQGLRPAIGYELNPWLLGLSNYRAWKAGYHGEVNLSDCYNVIVFLAPSVQGARLLAWQFSHNICYSSALPELHNLNIWGFPATRGLLGHPSSSQNEKASKTPALGTANPP
ncbi:adenine nucleotide translocase lysine N-methyltransferase isoform X3 [Heliangelus exortis]|uniref:adenine nucleotide translocase lysine N-methyltransferase isoform X3 n=1 Tax=Heliangelus exortis TaxID=472823 RepID=UPI003A8E8AC7